MDSRVMKGAEALLHVLADNGVEVCFANPGTSEMQMVAAFDHEPRVRGVLCLFEGVVTGAADGYGRIAGKPAATLLHLGPGLANGVANLHNARRAGTPILNLVGEHASFHRHYDSPLTSDIEGLARTVSAWVKVAGSAQDACALAVEAIEASLGPPGGSATLLLPADFTWSPTLGATGARVRPRSPVAVSAARIEAAGARLRAADAPVVLLGSAACTEAALAAAGRLKALGVRVMTDTFVSRLPRGEGRFQPERMPFFGKQASEELKAVDLLFTVCSQPPVAFFGYPDTESRFLPAAETLELVGPREDPVAALQALAHLLGAPAETPRVSYDPPPMPSDKLNAHTVGAVIANLLPKGAIISDDAATSGAPIFTQTARSRAHDYLFLTGGAIGQGLPVALGAAMAAPDRKVVCVIGDGAAAYTPQALWSMARENADVVCVVMANHAYRILNIELERTGATNAGEAARQLLDLERPRIDWVAMASGWGLQAELCDTITGFISAFGEAMKAKGPRLIEVAMR